MRRYGFAAADVGIRGYNETSNPRLLVLLNGQQVYLDDIGRTQWYTLPVELDEIRQIEIVKGPNTALFGFNAASGVINIITYDPMRESVNTATRTCRHPGLHRSCRRSAPDGLQTSAACACPPAVFVRRSCRPANVSPLDLPFRESPERNAFSFDATGKGGTHYRGVRLGRARSDPHLGADIVAVLRDRLPAHQLGARSG